MKVYALRNSNGDYISMSGDTTVNWFEASKFPKADVGRRKKYADEQFKLVEFDVAEVVSDINSMKIEELGLSVRSYSVLKRHGIDYIHEILEYTDDDYMRVKNIGRLSMEEIKEKLSSLDLR